MINIRLIYNKKPSSVQLSDDSTIGDLFSWIQANLHLQQSKIRLLHGFPPRSINLSPTVSLKPFHQSVVSIEVVAPSSSSPPNTTSNLKALKIDINADNSCLFNAIAFIVEGQRTSKATEYRNKAVDYLLSHSEDFDEATLGRPLQEYIGSLLDPVQWGGYVEIVLLSRALNLCINAIDIETLRVDSYPVEGCSKTGFLLYSGIHYDAVSFRTANEQHTLVDSTDEIHLERALELAKELQLKRDYVNVKKFTLKCLQCSQPLVGQEGAVSHAKETGHVNFGEY
ncbi:hypothetical protein GEMRC1_008003 [Eukaryota sp. GEM-RC1]